MDKKQRNQILADFARELGTTPEDAIQQFSDMASRASARREEHTEIDEQRKTIPIRGDECDQYITQWAKSFGMEATPAADVNKLREEWPDLFEAVISGLLNIPEAVVVMNRRCERS